LQTGEAQVSVGSNPTLSASTNSATKDPQLPELQTDLPAAEPRERRAGRLVGGLPRWVALPAAAGLIALVALASRSAAAPPVSVAIDTSPLVSALKVAGYVAEFVGIAGLLAAMIMYRARTLRAKTAEGSGRRPPPMPWWAQFVGLFAVVAVIAGQCAIIVSYVLEILRALRTRQGGGAAGSGQNPLDLSPGLAGRDPTSIIIAFVIFIALLLLLLVVAIRWRMLDRRFAAEGVGDHRTAAEAAVDVSLEALRREPDPRRAVIAAYAAMERALSGAGLGRHRSEAPMEYVRRVLTEQTRAPDEVRTVTDLFQVAKFSQHPVDEGMRTGAIDALEHIRAATARVA
jgi:hypothetical protein